MATRFFVVQIQWLFFLSKITSVLVLQVYFTLFHSMFWQFFVPLFDLGATGCSTSGSCFFSCGVDSTSSSGFMESLHSCWKESMISNISLLFVKGKSSFYKIEFSSGEIWFTSPLTDHIVCASGSISFFDIRILSSLFRWDDKNLHLNPMGQNPNELKTGQEGNILLSTSGFFVERYRLISWTNLQLSPKEHLDTSPWIKRGHKTFCSLTCLLSLFLFCPRFLPLPFLFFLFVPPANSFVILSEDISSS